MAASWLFFECGRGQSKIAPLNTSPALHMKKGCALLFPRFCFPIPTSYSHPLHTFPLCSPTHTCTRTHISPKRTSIQIKKKHPYFQGTFPHWSHFTRVCLFFATMPPQPCRFFRLGNCRNGDQCRFYHEGFSEFMNTDTHAVSNFEEDVCTDDEEEDEEEDDVLGYSYGNATRQTSAPITRNTINHDNRQADVDTPRTESTSRYSKPCRWYMAGYCLRGDECWFSHDLSSSHRPDGASIFLQDEAISSSSSAPRHEDDRKCAICLELPTTFGLLGKQNTEIEQMRREKGLDSGHTTSDEISNISRGKRGEGLSSIHK